MEQPFFTQTMLVYLFYPLGCRAGQQIAMIEYLEIEGFKSIKQLQIELRPINVLIGSNGAGKSNFVSFFKLLNALYNQRLANFTLNEGVDNVFHFGRKTTESLYGKLIFSRSGIDTNNAYWFQLTPNQHGGLFVDSEGYGYNVDPEDDRYNYFVEHDLMESLLLNKQDYRYDYIKSYLSGIQMYHFHDTSNTSRLRTPCEIEDNLALAFDGRNLPAFLFYLQEQEPKRFRRLVKVIQSIAPYLDRFILQPSRHNPQEIALRWSEKGDPESSFSAYQLSDGTLRFIALATVLMQPNPPEVIIIDEPELGLHPQAITKLAGLIRMVSNTTQLIISTQSVNLVSCFEPEDIITVDRSQAENQSIFRRLAPESLNDWLKDHTLGELWDRNIIDSAQPFPQ